MSEWKKKLFRDNIEKMTTTPPVPTTVPMSSRKKCIAFVVGEKKQKKPQQAPVWKLSHKNPTEVT